VKNTILGILHKKLKVICRLLIKKNLGLLACSSSSAKFFQSKKNSTIFFSSDRERDRESRSKV
jgi:hypothetical protein